MSKAAQHQRLTPVLICLALALLTLVAFWSVQDGAFINYDDDVYVYENFHVQAGLNPDSIRAAFSTDLLQRVTNWHPLTWLSLMLDASLFGLNPSGYHLVNLFLHILSTILLFLVMSRMTQTLWPCAFVACLFAIHPLHVESVAWVTERKDVLSGLFWMLTLWAYSVYVERPGFKRYVPVFVFFALGLLAKPMNVTLPFVLLLLDYWPLRRSSVAFLILEKAPLLLLSVVISVVTYLAAHQGGVVASFDALPLDVRIGNALVSYAAYLGKMIWPVHLAVYYPHPGMVIAWKVAGAVLVLAAITLFVILRAKTSPYLVTGWFWYLGTLAPVIGIVQNSNFAMADRYTYIPLTGIFLMVAWGVPDLLTKWRYRKVFLWAFSILIICALCVMTIKQTGYWMDSITLFDRTLEVTEDNNRLAYNNRGSAHADLGHYGQALKDYDRAIEIDPRHAKSWYNRGAVYGRIGNYQRAMEDFTKTLEIDPKFKMAYFNRGGIHGMMGNHPQAIADFSRAIALDEGFVKAYANRGMTYLMMGENESGCRDVQKACALGDCRAWESAKGRGACRFSHPYDTYDNSINSNRMP